MNSHVSIQPNILYYGMPILLLSTSNEDGSTNLSPLSSSWALGDCIVLGMGIQGQAYANIMRLPQCVINLPEAGSWEQVEQIASYTGMNPVPEAKQQLGFRYRKDKFSAGGWTPQTSAQVGPMRVAECPLQLEAEVHHIRVPEHTPYMAIVEVKVVHVHAHPHILQADHKIDPLKWQPLIYNFRHYFGLGDQKGASYRAKN
ncbi:flavin reductase family protein [Paenibacillus massiliensis]|uniref:flavin reductase family protein n=1 Tax=Paenibacillus massiliensis TaxID=225917 RepID=UPI000419F573|nr:flavin reductase family protein [Paenibacillus massiliensis]